VVAATAAVATSLGWAGTPTSALGQSLAPVRPPSLPQDTPFPLAGNTLAASRPTIGPGQLPCPDCNPPKRPLPAFGQLMAWQVVPWAFTKYVRGGEWSDITFTSWLDNLKFPWQWDNNKFNNNQFSHPYHGNLYFNAARTNGYNFWESTPWAFGGSLMWELFGEVWAPAPNDLANTTLGGITLGEMLWRLSTLTLRNEATGKERTFRETAALLINPNQGLTRLVRGEMNDVTETPPEWRPLGGVQAAMDVGYRRFSAASSLSDPSATDQFFVQFTGVYGDERRSYNKAPFSSFQVVGTLASRTENSKTLQELRVRGNLTGKPLGSDSSASRLVLFMTYEYLSNPAIEFGAQGVQGGLVTGAQPTKNLSLYGELLARFNPIAALRSDYFVTAEGRDYDYGISLGGRAEGRAVWKGKGLLRVNGGYVWLPVISGFSAHHNLWVFGSEIRGYVRGKYGLGAVYNRLWRRSNYEFNPDVDRDESEARVFVSLAIPRWQP
jgi:hypothetical protein